ncbi:MAG TPA: endolytic transglycosylase MltG, partial [Hyphomicrobiaceae bacterium]|nr:endolytic transglycosylase MltG [Hyphomicrobiaceae bacterium]
GIVGGQVPLGRAISKADKDTRTPYNTYHIPGLPPTPICNPGRSALEATLNPARTSDLFFVVDLPTGRHTFTTNYKDHLAAVALLRKSERERAAAAGQPPPPADPQPASPAKAAAVVENAKLDPPFQPFIPDDPGPPVEPSAEKRGFRLFS